MRISLVFLGLLIAGLTAQAKTVELTVRKPDGTPAAGATVAIVAAEQGVMLTGLKLDDDVLKVKTSATGIATFEAPKEPFLIVAVDDSGFAKASTVEPELKLVPWGSIEGVLKIGNHVGAKQSIGAWPDDGQRFDPKAPQFAVDARTTTDANGHFVLHHLPPGMTSVARGCEWHMPGNRSASAYTQNVKVDVRTGETATVEIGGLGRPVVGRLVLPNDLAKRDDWAFGLCNVGRRDDPLPLPMPDEMKKAPLEDQQKWYAAFNASDAGKKFAADQWKKLLADHSQYPMDVQRDGSFRIDDLPAGAFKLHAELISKGGNGHRAGDTLASVDSAFDVPPMPNGRSDDPLQIADVPVQAYSIIRVGDVAPDFAIKTLDGKPLKLSDFRGKLVLLDFWATWCGPCVAELPNIKEANDHFMKSGQVQFISLSMDDGPFEPKAYVDEHGYNWTQGFLGSFDSNPVTKNYGIESIPSVWLIGKDGKVIDKNLRGARVKEAIEKALN